MNYFNLFEEAIKNNESCVLETHFLDRGSGKTWALTRLALKYGFPIIVGTTANEEAIYYYCTKLLTEEMKAKGIDPLDSPNIIPKDEVKVIVIRSGDELRGRKFPVVLMDESVHPGSVGKEIANYGTFSNIIGFVYVR
jgi:hypothetical protein